MSGPAALLAFAAIAVPALLRGQSAPIVVDDFEHLAAWSVHPSDGVTARITPSAGVRGHALRLDFDFHGHAGYAIIRRRLDLDLPEDYAFSFWLRGAAPSENLEFKLIDSTGDNVWWNDARDVRFPARWARVGRRRRDIVFAWGPRGGGVLRRAAYLEISVTAGSGGRGTVWLDELTFEAREPQPSTWPAPATTASSSAPGTSPSNTVDADTATVWRAAAGDRRPWLALDFGRLRDLGGLVIDWAPASSARSYLVERFDGARWDTVYSVTGALGARDYVPLPGLEARTLRIRLAGPGPGARAGIRTIAVELPAFSATPDAMFARIAADAPRGSYPRAFTGEQSYWTVAGASGDDRQALVGSDGVVEPFRGGFSLEPFLRVGDTLVTWADAQLSQSLARNDLPIPSVSWRRGALRLVTTATVVGDRQRSRLLVRYRLHNDSRVAAQTTLYVALRPLQVNPPTQFLGVPGGVAPITSIRWTNGVLHVLGDSADGERRVVPITAPAAVGAAAFAEGAIVRYLRAGTLPPHHAVRDPAGYASAALAYPLTLPPSSTRDVYLEVPLHPEHDAPPIADADAAAAAMARAERAWAARLDRVGFTLPPAAERLGESIRANLAWILVERSGDALRPGTRAYARSWIRDGAMMAAALDRLGYADLSRRYAEWFAPYQFADGKVPCCVDARGADPVLENDSDGELIYLVAEYWRMSGDTATVVHLWPHVERAVAYIDSLRHLRMTAEYRDGDRRAYYGLLPQSISHEGYSAKPMHSYWDDLFALRGLADAADMAAAIGRTGESRRIRRVHDELQRDLRASIQLAMVQHHIDYVPGSVELGDFDPTSTTVYVAPGGELGGPLDAALRRTFERYWRDLSKRQTSGTWDVYTPYELRAVGTFVRLGWPARAREALDFFYAGQRPAAWRQWAEVVGRDSAAPRFIGDMPHAWVASDFLRSAIDLFAYERATDGALVVAAGLPAAWAASPRGVGVRSLGTYYGKLTYALTVRGDTVRLRVGGGLRLPRAGLVFRSPVDRPLSRATVDGVPVVPDSRGEVVVHHAPAEVVIVHLP